MRIDFTNDVLAAWKRTEVKKWPFNTIPSTVFLWGLVPRSHYFHLPVSMAEPPGWTTWGFQRFIFSPTMVVDTVQPVDNLWASLRHPGRRGVVLGHTLNTLWHVTTKKTQSVLSKFMILCWAPFAATLAAWGLQVGHPCEALIQPFILTFPVLPCSFHTFHFNEWLMFHQAKVHVTILCLLSSGFYYYK